LFSGGLDSILAGKVLAAQNIEITLVCFESHFFSCGKAAESAQKAGMELRVADIAKEHLEIVKNSRYGRGAGANPCIDCHLLMLKTAKAIMENEGFDFVATGEVMGQRPMSQNKLSLEIVERESGLVGKLLRPLSAKILRPTEVEIKGLVNRERLYGLSGRSRKPQLELAKQFGLKEIPQPGGGCILTEPEYGKRLKELMAKCANFSGGDARLLRCGRPIWEGDLLVVVARDQNDCIALKDLAKTGDWLFEPQNFPGPIVIIRDFGKLSAPNLETIKNLGEKYVLRYSKKIPFNPKIKINRPD